MEMANGISTSQDNGLSSSASTAGTESSVSNNSSNSTSQHAERTFTRSELAEIVKRERSAVEKKYESQLQSVNPQTQQQNYQPNEDHYRKIAAEEASRMRETWMNEAKAKTEAEQAQRIVNNFWQKVNAGKEKYSDFDKVTGDIELARFPNTVQLLAEYIDNSGDVLYELGKDRFKMAQLEQLSHMSPKDAIVQAQRLAQSLKDNDQAMKLKLPNEPLSQMRPSGVGTDSGASSFKDLRSKYRA